MISVIMATYNASQFVAAAIDSILNQTYPNFELIIVDDGSTDNTLEILQRYAAQDSRVRVIQADHGGPSVARNIAIEAAQYPWIAVMDADDIALPQRLEKQIAAAEADPEVVAWGGAVHHINAKGELLSISTLGPKTKEAFYRQRKNGHAVNLNHPTALFKKEIMQKVGGYDPKFRAAQDLELLDRMAAYGPILATPEPLVLYRIHAQSISMQKFFVQRQAMRYVRKRHQARLRGEPELTFEQYVEMLQQQPWHKRFSKHLETMGIYYYRKSGLHYSEKQYFPAGFYMLLSAGLNPGYSIDRVWKQVLSPKAKQSLEKSSSEV